MAVRKRMKAQGTRSGKPGNKVIAPDSRASTPVERQQRENSCSMEQIQLRAYELFLARGGRHGDDLADWFMAERELRGNSPG